MLPPAIILAGGQSRRMGVADKCLLPLGSKAIIEHVIQAMLPQVSCLVISTNSDPAKFSFLNLPIVADTIPGFQGPLAGILSGMLWARECDPGAKTVVTAPADVPFLPENLVSVLMASRDGVDVVIASSPGQPHPTIGLWPIALADRLSQDLQQTNMRKVTQWLRQFRVREVEFPRNFLNINSAEDLLRARSTYPVLDRADGAPL